MSKGKDEWLVLVVSAGGHLVPTPEHLAPNNTMYLDDDGVIRDRRIKPDVPDQEAQPVDDTPIKIKHLLENRKTILTDAVRLSIMGDMPDDIEGLTVRAVDFSRPAIQSQSNGQRAQDNTINMIDSHQIEKEQARQRDERRQAIEAASDQADDVRLLDELIIRLPWQYCTILQNVFYLNYNKEDLRKVHGSGYLKKIDVAIRELSEQYKAAARRHGL